MKADGTGNVTTSATGFVATTIPLASKVVVAAAEIGTNDSHIVIPFVANNLYWYFSVRANIDLGYMANTQVDILYYYYDL